MVQMTYFKNYTDRFFFLYGNTKDEFYTSDLKCINLDKVLHKHLSINNYKRIVYYHGTKGLSCYDEYSFKSAFSKKEIEVKKKRNLTNSVLKGVLGSRLKKNTTSNNLQTTNKNANLVKKLQDEDIVSHFDTLMKDKELQTALIFSDFNDFILHTKQEVVRNFNAKLSDWDELPSLNKNIVIFIVPQNISLKEIKSNTNRFIQWQQLTSKMFLSNEDNDIRISSQMIMISKPNKDEIFNLVNLLRLQLSWEVDWLEFDKNIDILFKLIKERDYNLKLLSAKLQELKNFNTTNILKLFDKEKEMSGSQQLAKMRGLEYLNEEIQRLVKYANSKKIVIEDAVTDEVKRILPQSKRTSLDVNLHISLTGNPGTGKTTVAKIISEIFKENNILDVGHIVKVTRDDLVGEHVGSTAIKTKEKIDQAIGGMLFVDEAYTLAKGGENDFGKEAIDTILEAMTDRNGEFSVIIAGYPDDMENFLTSNAGLKRRFAHHIHLKDYEPEVLLEIFVNRMKKDGVSFDDELEELFIHFIQNWFDTRDEKTFGNAGDVLNLFDKMAQSAIFDDRKVLIKSDVPQELQKHLKKQTDGVMAEALAKLDGIVGLESVKENIRSIIASIKMAKLRDDGSKIAAGHYIFKGNPGTGKTTVARIFGEVLKELKVLKKGHFVEVGREDLVGNHVGDTAKKTKEVLKNSQGGILFIDEAYSLSKGGENDFGKEAIDTIVPFMENNINNFTLIVAGYDEDMNKFLDANTGLKSRFTNTIHFEDYSNEELLQIFKTFSKEYVLGNGVEDAFLEKFTQMKAGAKHFGNGRESRKLFDAVRTNLDKRLLTISDLQKGDERLYMIEMEDVTTL